MGHWTLALPSPADGEPGYRFLGLSYDFENHHTRANSGTTAAPKLSSGKQEEYDSLPGTIRREGEDQAMTAKRKIEPGPRLAAERLRKKSTKTLAKKPPSVKGRYIKVFVRDLPPPSPLRGFLPT